MNLRLDGKRVRARLFGAEPEVGGQRECGKNYVLETDVRIRDVLDRHENVLSIFLELYKAFDCVHHDSWLFHLEAYDIRGTLRGETPLMKYLKRLKLPMVLHILRLTDDVIPKKLNLQCSQDKPGMTRQPKLTEGLCVVFLPREIFLKIAQMSINTFETAVPNMNGTAYSGSRRKLTTPHSPVYASVQAARSLRMRQAVINSIMKPFVRPTHISQLITRLTHDSSCVMINMSTAAARPQITNAAVAPSGGECSRYSYRQLQLCHLIKHL
ncbi:hypothetical protein J6590_038688 [Homalodisca vitripennis]|nr:hypothetical protein J6590_038688 [Homalodisca vitripennis]